MARYRKRPVIIEAVQIRLSVLQMERPQWLVDAIREGRIYWQGVDAHYSIETLEGTMRANLGDWIVRGVKCELYPVRDDIFRETYEPVTD